MPLRLQSRLNILEEPDSRLHSATEPPSPSESPRPRLRPILCRSSSMYVAPLSSSGEKRSVSFRLPEESDTARSRMAALARSLKRLTLAGAAAGAGRAKPEKAPKRILRQPVVHVYLRGVSGLPTQRVPLSSVNALHHPFRTSIS